MGAGRTVNSIVYVGGGQDKAGATWLDMTLNGESPGNPIIEGNSDTTKTPI